MTEQRGLSLDDIKKISDQWDAGFGKPRSIDAKVGENGELEITYKEGSTEVQSEKSGDEVGV